MKLVGIRRKHAYSEMAQAIPLQWGEFVSRFPISGSIKKYTYGVICGHGEGWCEYLAGIEVSDFENAPSDLGRMIVPPATYAVFEHHSHVSGIRNTWQAIWESWLPTSEYEGSPTPDFERYDERYDPVSCEGGIEIWFPVKKKA